MINRGRDSIARAMASCLLLAAGELASGLPAAAARGSETLQSSVRCRLHGFGVAPNRRAEHQVLGNGQARKDVPPLRDQRDSLGDHVLQRGRRQVPCRQT